MSDQNTTIAALKEKNKKFVAERDWAQFHTPKNLSMNIAIEAAELMELFVWTNNDESYKTVELKRQEIENEIADIALNLLSFCAQNNIDLTSAIEHKMQLNAQKYPVEKVKGKAKKYTEYAE